MRNNDGIKFLYHGLVLLLLGIFLYGHRRLLQEAGWGIFWPFIPLALGLLLLLEFRRTRKKLLLAAGAFLAGSGGFLLVFTLEYLPWSRLADLWAFFPVLAGFSLFLVYLSDFSGRGYLIAAVILLAAGLLGLGKNLPAMVKGFGPYGQFSLAAFIFLLFLLVSGKRKPG